MQRQAVGSGGGSVGQGVAFPTLFAVAATGVDDAEQGVASGLAASGQQVGSAIGLAILVAIANGAVDERLDGAALQAATADGLRTALLVAAGGVALTVLVARRLRLPPAYAGGSVDEAQRR